MLSKFLIKCAKTLCVCETKQLWRKKNFFIDSVFYLISTKLGSMASILSLPPEIVVVVIVVVLDNKFCPSFPSIRL